METKFAVTSEQIKANMNNIVVRTTEEFGQQVTEVTVTMENGFVIRESVASDPDLYDEEVDKEYCLKSIKIKILLLLKYSLQERLFKQKKEQKKEQKNIPKKFKPFQKVLVKVTNDDDNHVWVAAIYSHYNESKGRHYFSNLQWTDDDSYIIPFEGNESKLGQIAE